jgi:hypothetical protein
MVLIDRQGTQQLPRLVHLKFGQRESRLPSDFRVCVFRGLKDQSHPARDGVRQELPPAELKGGQHTGAVKVGRNPLLFLK